MLRAVPPQEIAAYASEQVSLWTHMLDVITRGELVAAYIYARKPVSGVGEAPS